jgi:hypothetical protein
VIAADLVFPVPRSLQVRYVIRKANASLIVYSFARIFRDELQGNEDQAASSSGRASDYATVPVQGSNLCLSTPIVGFRPQMTLAFISGISVLLTPRSYGLA